MWTCPKCANKVDPSFEVCWNCGTTPDGVEDPDFVSADAAPPSESPLDLEMPEGDAPIPESASELEGELVECYLALDLMQAKFLADRLSEDGIPAMCDADDVLTGTNFQPRVFVRAADLSRAKLWLEEFERKNQAEHGGLR
jgi:hypothetical protein